MRKEELVNHLKELPTLESEWRECAHSWDKDWFVGNELTEYTALVKIESDIDERVQEAEKTITRPIPEYPEEYQVIMAQLKELKPYIEQVDKIGSALINLNAMYFPQARKIRDVFWEKSATEMEYQELSETKERKERKNSKVEKLKRVTYETYQAEVKKVKKQTRERLEMQHADSLKHKRVLELLARSRRQEKLDLITVKIMGLLDTITGQK